MKRPMLVLGGFAGWTLAGLLTLGAASQPGAARPPQLWAIIIGIGNYADPTVPDNSAAPAQAASVLQWFRAAGWDEDHQLLLRDFGSSDPGTPEAPSRNILPTRNHLSWAVEKWLFRRARPGDVVVFYVAGATGYTVADRGPRVDPRVDHYIIPIDGVRSDLANTGWSLDRAVDQCALRKLQVVCWLATMVGERPSALSAVPEGPRGPAPGTDGQEWLRRLVRWPGVTAWLAADRRLASDPNADPVVPFTTAILEGLGTHEARRNLASCLRSLRQSARLRLLGFQALGGIPPVLWLWRDELTRPSRAVAPELVLQVGHADQITDLAATADNRLVISASLDSTVRAWSLEDRSLLRIWAGQSVGATALGLSHDDRWLVIGGGRGGVMVCDLKDGTSRPIPRRPHLKGVTRVVLLPDGDHFLTLDRGGRAMRCDLRVSPLEPAPWPDAMAECREVAAGGGPDRGLVVARFADGSTRQYDSAGNRGTAIPTPSAPTALAVAPEGGRIVLGFADGTVAIRDSPGGDLRVRRAADGPIRKLLVSSHGDVAIVSPRGLGLIRGSNPVQQGGEASIGLLERPVGSLAFSMDGRHLAASSENVGELWVWRLDDEAAPNPLLSDPSAQAAVVGFSGDGGSLVIGGFDGSIATRPIVGIGPEKLPAGAWQMAANRGRVQKVESTDNRRFLLAITESFQALIWDLVGRTCVRLPGAWSSGVFLSDDHLVLTAAADAPNHAGRLVKARRLRDRARVEYDPDFFSRSAGGDQVPPTLVFEGVRVSPEGSRVAATATPSQPPLVCVWDARTGRLTHRLTNLEDPVRSLSFAADARWILTAGDSPTAYLWDLSQAEGEVKRPLAKFHDPSARNVTCAAIRPGGRQVVTGHSDGQVRLWSWEEGKAVLEVPELVEGVFAGDVRALAFTADGRMLAAAGDGTTIWLGDMEPRPSARDDLNRLRPHHLEQINGLLAWSDPPMLVSGSDDTTVRFWDLKRGKLWGTFTAISGPRDLEILPQAPVPELDWVFYTPEGFFDASAEGTKLVHFRQRAESHPVDQLETTHYTFRLGAQLLGGEPPRPARLEEPPPISVLAPPRLDASIPETELTVTLDPSQLKEIRLYHNDRPIPTGLERSQGPLPSEFQVKVRLLEGINRFYAMASRDGAYDSRSRVVEIPYKGTVEQGRLHVVALGVGDYERRRLKYAERDAERISEVLHARGLETARRPGMRIFLPNSEATVENVERAFAQIAERVEDSPQDKVVVYLAGHTGVFESGRFGLLLPSYPFPAGEAEATVVRDAVARGEEGAPLDPRHVLPYSVVAANLMRLKALNRLVIVDACQAEAILEDPQVAAIQKWMEVSSRRARTSYLMAARRGEPALEVDPLGHGLFTYTLLRGMGAIPPREEPEEVAELGLPPHADLDGDGILTTSELDAYTKQNLPPLAELFPTLVASREARLTGRRTSVPPAQLAQRASLQSSEVSFPLVRILSGAP